MEAIIVTHMVCVQTTMDRFHASAKMDFQETVSMALVRVSYLEAENVIDKPILCFPANMPTRYKYAVLQVFSYS